MSKEQARGPRSKQEYQRVDVNWWWFLLGALVVAIVVLIAESKRTPIADREERVTNPTRTAQALSQGTEAAAQSATSQAVQATQAVLQATQDAMVSLTQAAQPTQDVPNCTQNGKQWQSAPEMSIDPSKSYVATLKTTVGDITINLFAKEAPVTVNSFVFLAKEDFYDCTFFHRVLPDFMAQGGDPTGTGTGGPGYQFEDEIVDTLTFDRQGLLAMANSGPNTNGSQFFITFVPTDWLNGNHTIFGEVTAETYPVVQMISLRDPGTATAPGTFILDVTIDEK